MGLPSNTKSAGNRSSMMVSGAPVAPGLLQEK
jgi:hypothetical protein